MSHGVIFRSDGRIFTILPLGHMIIMKQLNSVSLGSRRCLYPSENLGYEVASYLCTARFCAGHQGWRMTR